MRLGVALQLSRCWVMWVLLVDVGKTEGTGEPVFCNIYDLNFSGKDGKKKKNPNSGLPGWSTVVFLVQKSNPDLAVLVQKKVLICRYGAEASTDVQRCAKKQVLHYHTAPNQALTCMHCGLSGVGFGIYHSGIEVYGKEIAFGY